jgi:hypothetical protein
MVGQGLLMSATDDNDVTIHQDILALSEVFIVNQNLICSTNRNEDYIHP